MRRYILFHKELNEVVELGPVLMQNKYVPPSNQEYEERAWRIAVDSGLVAEADREKYNFKYRDLSIAS